MTCNKGVQITPTTFTKNVFSVSSQGVVYSPMTFIKNSDFSNSHK